MLSSRGLCDGLMARPEESHGFLSCECCVLSVRGLCDGLIPCPEESYGCLSLVSAVFCQVEVSATG